MKTCAIHFATLLFALATLIAGCASTPQLPEASVGDRRVPAVLLPLRIMPQQPLDQHVPGVANFGFISADVWRGAKPTPDGFRMLAAMGVRTVIDLQEVDEAVIIPVGVGYVPLRISGWHADQVDTVAVMRAIKECPKPVFIHCLEGRDRTGLAVAAYRLQQGMATEDVLAELLNFRTNFWWRSPIEARIRTLATVTTSTGTTSTGTTSTVTRSTPSSKVTDSQQ